MKHTCSINNDDKLNRNLPEAAILAMQVLLIKQASKNAASTYTAKARQASSVNRYYYYYYYYKARPMLFLPERNVVVPLYDSAV